MKSRLSVEVDRPVAEVFQYANDRLSEWSITCVEHEVLQPKPGGVGTTFRLVTEEKGRRMDFRGVVTKFEPPKASAVELTGDAFDIDVNYAFEDLDGRTRVTQESLVRGKGFFKVMFFLFGWLMKNAGCKAQQDELDSLKRHCEARATA